MTWDDYQRAELTRLLTFLKHYYLDLAEVRGRLVRYGVPPSDELRAEVERTMAATAILGQVARERLGRLDYRPLVGPWIGFGMNAKMRPDFKARGITKRDPPPPLV